MLIETKRKKQDALNTKFKANLAGALDPILNKKYFTKDKRCQTTVKSSRNIKTKCIIIHLSPSRELDLMSKIK